MLDAAARRNLILAYLAVGAYVVVVWALLLVAKVNEPQAYVLPLGLGLAALGWNERRHGRTGSYQLATMLGLLVLMGSAFLQSIGAASYALLLLVESLAAIAWGVPTRSRGYVQLGVLALIANAFAEIGPGFVALDRWVQIGTIGSLLLGGGLIALFRRESILSLRRAVTTELKGWQP